MAMTLRSLVLLAALAVALPVCAYAQSERFKEAMSAYQKQDYGTALYYWQQLADGGDGPSQYNLGILYLYGRGVPKNIAEAYKWFLLARDRHVDQADEAVAQIETTITSKDLNEGLKRRDDWRQAHGD